MSIDNGHIKYPFLEGGGEMGELTRSFDWSSTSVGSPAQWPAHLKITVSMLLSSKFPMFLWWGDDLIQFYNDAYRPSLGNNGKHPNAIGQKGKECWPEIWDIIYPLIDQVKTKGEATWNKDMLVPIYRNGHIEDVYWTFGYSPISDENGKIDGVLVVCTETTEKVESVRKLERSRKQFHDMVMRAPVAMAVYRGANHIAEIVNDAYLPLVGKTREEFLGKPLLESMPEARASLLSRTKEVMEAGKTSPLLEYPLKLNRFGKEELCYFDSIWEPLYEDDGTINGFMVVAHEVTEQVVNRKKTEENELRFRTMLSEAPVATALLTGRNMVIAMANAPMLGLWSRDDSIIGKELLEVLPEIADQPFPKLLDDVFTTGETYSEEEAKVRLIRNGKWDTLYRSFSYKPIRNVNGEVYGILIMAVDVTESVVARKKLLESEQQMRSLVEGASFPLGVYVGKEMRIIMANQAIMNAWDKKSDIIGKSFYDAIPVAGNELVFEQLQEVYETGIPFHTRNQRVDIEIEGRVVPCYFNYSFTPLFDSDGKVYGVMNTGADVTDINVANKKVEESEQNLRNVILKAPVAMCIFRSDAHVVEIANDRMIELWGTTYEQVLHKPIFEALPEVSGQGFEQLLDGVFHTGETFAAQGVPVTLPRNGGLELVYINFVYEAYYGTSDTISGVIAVATDVTEQVLARKKIETAEAALRGAIELAELATWSLDIERGIITYSARFMDWLGFSENTKDLDAAYEPLPDEYRISVPQAIEEGIKAGIYENEHPIVNRLTGQVRIIHAQAQVSYDAAGKPISLSGTAQDITAQRKLQLELEHQVNERTEELAAINEELQMTNEELAESNNNLLRSNAELAQFAYIASHDLQEPLRKVSTFIQMLEQSVGEIDDRSMSYLNKISTSTSRMITLVRDVLAYSQLSKESEVPEPVNLNEIIQNIKSDFELLIEQKGASIICEHLPTIEGIPLQMSQLFSNLISNSLKFVKDGVAPEITITGNLLASDDTTRNQSAKYLIEFRDNGIGFDQEHSEQIFNIFQRLHGKKEYSGTGIGLAICKKIVQNHHGQISATAIPGSGAVFHITLPAIQD